MKAQPTVRLDPRAPQPRLDWYLIYRYNQAAGELLAAFELILVSDGMLNEGFRFTRCVFVGEWRSDVASPTKVS